MTAIPLTRFVECLFELADLIEVRRLPSKRSTWHAASELPVLYDPLAKENNAGQNIYVGINPRCRPAGSAVDVALAHALFADWDDGVDADEARRRWEAAGLPEPTLLVQSGHGTHAYWRFVEALTDLADWSALQKALIAAVRSDKSIHDPPRIMRLPGFQNVKRKPFVPCSIVAADPTRRYALADLRHILTANAAATNGQSAPGEVAPPRGAPAGEATIERARRYLAKLDAAVSGQHGHDRTFHAACVLVQGFSLAPDEAWPVLAEWNQMCQPPWDEPDLRRKLAEADKQPGKRGYLLEAARENAKGIAPSGHGTRSTAPQTAAVLTEPGPILTCLADVEPRSVAWLWPGRIPLGRITLLVGRPGEGKSFVTIDAAARVSTGTPWPDGSDCPQGSVILISAEDDPGDTIRPRLDAHDADVRRVHLLSAVHTFDDRGPFDRLISLADVDAIEMALKSLPDCRLIVVDPIGSFLGGGTDAHRDNEVRGVLAPIAMLAEKYGPAVLVVAHRRKSAGNNADDLALGSRAFTGIARAVWHLTRDNENKARRLLLPGKNNLAHEGNGLAFSILGEPARISWERDPVAMTADDALAAETQAQDRRPGPDSEALDAALAWLRTALAGGPRLAKELLDEWKNGQGGSERTLKRAKHDLGCEAYRDEVPGPWWWKLPSKAAKPTEDVHLGTLGILADASGNSPFFDIDDSKGAKLPELGIVGGERVRVTL